MNYYNITTSSERKQIGVYPQCKGMPDGFNYKWFEEPNSMTNLTNDEFPNVAPNLIFELEERAKLTDVISPSNLSAKGILMNEKVKKIIDQFEIAEHNYYPATITHKGITYNYYWLHFVKKDLSGVDFEKSIFYKSEFGFDKGDYLKIDSHQKALKIYDEEDYFIHLEKLVLNSNQSQIHFFYLPILHNLFASENISEALKTNRVTGINLTLVN